ncbi:glycosyltransferase [Leifsonia sp. YIM 134122]|uniref:Glycosyltransferase n=1 Tax=Leifsonia stereocauli TaxID=3134136 RepID=A0ABU9W7L3_9MICO
MNEVPVAPTGPSRLRVLQSFGTPGATSNPYITRLFSSTPGVEQHAFSWRYALTGRFDVLHIHLVEVMFVRRGRIRTVVGVVLFLLLLLRTRVSRIGIVRTLHNVKPHEAQSRLVQWALSICDRRTDLWIRLNSNTVPPTGAPVVTIPHPDYREWFALHDVPASIPGRLLFFGLIRPYKDVDALVRAFTSVADDALSLHIVGDPQTAELREIIERAGHGDPRITLSFGYADDSTLATEIGESELITLPYREMHNSGAALLGLSLHRPVLVPDNSVTAALADEVGEPWVQRFSGAFDGTAIVQALASVRRQGSDGSPDLTARSWDASGSAHEAAYARAVELAAIRIRPRRAAAQAGGRLYS